MSRNQTVGVVVDPDVWEAVQMVAEEVLEDLLIAENWGDRVDHERLPAAAAGKKLIEILQGDGEPTAE